MNTRELENALLLRESGELSESELRELDLALETHPELAALASENELLQNAGTYSSSIVVPKLPELNRERILKSAKPSAGKRLPRLLAVAALLVMGLGLLPHLTNYLQTPPEVLTANVIPVRSSLVEEDPILNLLAELDSELSLWSSLDIDETLLWADENDWAEVLLTLMASEESI